MFIVLVHVHVLEDSIEAFQGATIENATASRLEQGIVRFDVIQQEDDPSRFILVEIYRTDTDVAHHKETDHYLKWREAITPMMAEGRQGIRYRIISPAEETWG